MSNRPALRRSHDGRMIAGLCMALARRWDVDPLLVRVGVIVLTVATQGLGLVAYLIAWLAIPSDTSSGPIRLPRLIGALALVGVVVGAVGTAFPNARTDAIALALLCGLAFVAYVAFRGRPQNNAPEQPWTPPAQPGPTGYARPDVPPYGYGQQPPMSPYVDAYGRPTQGATPYGPYGQAPQWQQPPSSVQGRPGRTPRQSWRPVLVASLIACAALGALVAVGVHVPGMAFAAVLLLIAGIALVRGSHHPGRPPFGLFPMALVVALVMLASMLPTHDAVRPSSLDLHDAGGSMPASTQFDGGDRVVTLPDDLKQDKTMEVSQDAGRLTLVLPKHVNTRVHADMSMGQLRAPGHSSGGLDQEFDQTYTVDPNAPTLTVNVSLDMGELVIQQ